MRKKEEILGDLWEHASKLDPQYYELAAVAISKTEIQIDMRDLIQYFLNRISDDIHNTVNKD